MIKHLLKVNGAPLFIDMDTKEQILYVGIDRTSKFVITTGWNRKTATIWHQKEIPASQLKAFKQAFNQSFEQE